MKRRALLVSSAVIAIAWACTPSDFDPSTKIESVRILGTRADGDMAYAKPGDSVTLDTLAVDARPNQQHPMTVYWIPYVCQDPKGDSYASCFAPSAIADAGAGAGDSGGGGGGGGAAAFLQPGTDLTPFLPTGRRFTFQVPPGIAIKHVEGAPRDYGLVILFNVACAGHVEVKAFDPSTGPQQVPIGCFDSNGTELTPNDYVIGFTRIYVYKAEEFAALASTTPLTNANPDVAGVVVNGVETATTSAVDRLAAPVDVDLPSCATGCTQAKIDLDVPAASWEINPNDLDANGAPKHEAIWVDYYATGGSIDGEARLLYDAAMGRISATEIKYTPPDKPGDATLYAVVHDDRDGITWVQVNVHAR